MVLEQLVGPLIGLAVLSAIFVPLERKFALVRRPLLRRGWFTDILHLFFTGTISNAFAIAGIVVAFLLVGWWTPAPMAGWLAQQHVIVQFLLAGLFGNVIGYWSHRWSHTAPILWRFHKVHHSSQNLDWLASARSHPLEGAWGAFVFGVPLIFLGFQVEQVAILQVLQVLWAIFIHSNVRFRFPVLRQLIATPEYHHWHHSADPEHYDTNYSLFPIIDRLFGTYYQPAWRAREFGVPGYEPGGYLRQMVEPFRRPRPKYGPFPLTWKIIEP